VGKDPKLFKIPDDIYANHLLKQQKDLSSKLLKLIPVIEKTMPTLKESEDPKPKVIKSVKK
jgi:hypothetical protein